MISTCRMCRHEVYTIGLCKQCGQCFFCCPRDCKRRTPQPTLLEEATAAVTDRHQKNDIPERNFSRIADIWSAILNAHITPEQVALMMIGVKLAREAYSHQRDNLVDLIGYTLCLEEIVNAHPAEEDACH